MTAAKHPTNAQHAYLTALAAGEGTGTHTISTQLACLDRRWVTSRVPGEDYGLTDAGRAAIELGPRAETGKARRRRAARRVFTALSKITSETDLTLDDIADALGVHPVKLAASAYAFKSRVLIGTDPRRTPGTTASRLAHDIDLMLMCEESGRAVGFCRDEPTCTRMSHTQRSVFMDVRGVQVERYK